MQGPRTRSKRARSSLTHFKGPRAITVAALGRLRTKAISPRIMMTMQIKKGIYHIITYQNQKKAFHFKTDKF